MIKYCIAMAITLCLCPAALGQDERPQMDESGKGAVLCVWSIYVGLQQGSRLCELEQRPGDDAIARDISRIEAFILEHNRQGITQSVLDDYKADALQQTRALMEEQRAPFCQDVAMMRDAMGKDIAGHTDDLLSVPREPLWNPCI